MNLARRAHAVIIPAMAMMLVISHPCWALQKAPASGPGPDSLESAPLVAENAAGVLPKTDPTASSSGMFDITRVVLALGGVIGLIVLLRVFAKRVIPGAASPRASSSVKIVGRCSITARQTLLVIQFGRRLLLVGDGGTNLNPLCEISDPDEVASILAQARDETISVARRFESIFGRAKKDFDETSEAPAAPDSFDESRDLSGEEDDPALRDTRKEIADLREKVRDVARTIARA